MSCRPAADDESDNYELHRSRRYSPDSDVMVIMPSFRIGAFCGRNLMIVEVPGRCYTDGNAIMVDFSFLGTGYDN